MKALGLGPGIEGKRVVVQGLGNVGYFAAKFFQEAGAVLVGLAESEGAIANPKGLDLQKVMAHRRDRKSIADFPGASNLPRREDALELECDILIPAALERQITAENAARVKAKLVVEAANGPTTPEADEILDRRNVMVIPDAYINAGGVTVSYFEWVQDLNRDHWSEQIVNEKLKVIMVKAFQETLAIAKRDEIDMRTAAYIVAINRVSANAPTKPKATPIRASNIPRPITILNTSRGWAPMAMRMPISCERWVTV